MTDRRLRPAWALVPAKSFDRGKSRLAPVLGGQERAAFARGLFDHVLAVLIGSEALDGVLVATDSPSVAEAARRHGAAVRMDDAPAGLSVIVDAALADLAARGARAALVVMADLPRLAAEDVRALLAALDESDVVVVPDLRGRHTNALALAPPTALPTRFGSPDSFAAHCAGAREAGLRLRVIENDRIAFDVDGPDDHRLL
ncbi:MAG: 2-phospho-L-lactate guanylyltransferase [Myxococcales bacterium]|nr:2-phospho-L-lactate guanylyltransferase [Myxococcales bacterium]